jgi:two-component system sensor histidine kinase BaeS
MKTFALATIGFAVAMAAVEVYMRPTASQRLAFALTLGSAALLTAVVGLVLNGRARRRADLKLSIALPALVGIGIAALTVLVSALFMFVSSHDLQVFLIAIALGVGLALILAMTLSSDLQADLRKLVLAIEEIAGGNRHIRVRTTREGELGRACDALNILVTSLRTAEEASSESKTARQRMLAALSHDLRTPLTAMRAAVEALQDGVADDPTRYLAILDADLRAMGDLVDDLFLLSRLEAGGLVIDTQSVDLVELADEAIEALAPVADRAGIGVEVVADDEVFVTGGSRELARAIRNLLDNAIRYTPHGSQVQVRISNGGPKAKLEVVDEGPGFPPGFASRAYDQFTRGDPARSRVDGGAGLGLAIVKGIIDAHQGRVWIDDGPGAAVGFEVPA